MPNDRPTTNHSVESDNTTPEFQLEPPDWEFWRQRGACRIWQAVLLSINVEPTKANRDLLPTRGSQSNDEYVRRREIVNVQYGIHQLLPTMEHPRAGKSGSGRYIALPKLLEFAKEIGWRGIRDFENGLSRSTVRIPTGEDVEVNQEFEDLSKGERYTLVRMGALLSLLERCICPGSSSSNSRLLHGTSLNLTAIGREVEKIIATAAHEAERSTVANFSEQVNRKQMAAAADALKIFF